MVKEAEGYLGKDFRNHKKSHSPKGKKQGRKELVKLGAKAPLPQRPPGAPSTGLPFGANGIQLINEDDRWRLLLGQGKGITDQFGTIPNEHLHQLGASQLQKGGLR